MKVKAGDKFGFVLPLVFALAVEAVASEVWRHGEREPIWPEGRMPDFQMEQIACMTDEKEEAGFRSEAHRMPYLEWFEEPADPNGSCMILISGGGYWNCCDVDLVRRWKERLTGEGYRTVNLVYRTPRPRGLAYYQTAWEDGQRAVRLVRSQAKRRGFDPEKVGVIGMSAGGHLATLLATSALTPAYGRVDALDDVPCHVNWCIANAPAYNTCGGGATGDPFHIDGTINEFPRVDSAFRFDARTCPISFHHGAVDGFTPNGSTRCYRELRRRRIPAELHLYADRGHGAWGLDRAVEFMRQMNFDGRLGAEVGQRAFTGEYTASRIREELWPTGKTPTPQPNQTNAPFMTWFIPKTLKTKAIQVVFPGGAYEECDLDNEGWPVAEGLNKKGMAAVVVGYRCPRPVTSATGSLRLGDWKLPKYWSAWEDARRAICKVRGEAAERGLDPARIGVMGFSAGGHLALLSALSSTFYLYHPVDEYDNLPCNVQWACPISPAYALTDGVDSPSAEDGLPDGVTLVPEFLFDVNTPPMCFIHGDADGWSAMNSVKTWERLRRMGVSCDLHTLATRGRHFQLKAAPGTGSFAWLDRVWDFLDRKGFVQ